MFLNELHRELKRLVIFHLLHLDLHCTHMHTYYMDTNIFKHTHTYYMDTHIFKHTLTHTTQIHTYSNTHAGRWWRTPLIPVLGRQRQEDLCEFETSLVYKS